MGSLGLTQLRICETKGVVSSIYTKMIRFKEKLCFVRLRRRLGQQEGNFFGYPLWMTSFKTNFQRQRPRLLHNLS
jgi:hypothetical protein